MQTKATNICLDEEKGAAKQQGERDVTTHAQKT
jgi:hypothetical protein